MIEFQFEQEFQVPFGIAKLAASSGKVICVGKNGQFAVFNPESKELKQFQLEISNDLENISIAPHSGVVACLSGIGVTLVDTKAGDTEHLTGGFESCCFGDGESLWTSRNNGLIEKRRWPAGEVLASLKVEVPYDHVLLDAHPSEGCVVYSSGQQEGQTAIWVSEEEGELVINDEMAGDGLGNAYSYDCEELYIVDDLNFLRYSTTDCEEVDSFDWDEWEEGFPFFEPIALSPQYCLLHSQSEESPSLIVDVEAMEVAGEVELPAHPYVLRAMQSVTIALVEKIAGASPFINLGSRVKLGNWKLCE